MSQVRQNVIKVPNSVTLYDEKGTITDVISFNGIQKLTVFNGAVRGITNGTVVCELRDNKAQELLENYTLWLQHTRPSYVIQELVG